MRYNPRIHKSLKRMCDHFQVKVTDEGGGYADLSIIQSRLKKAVGY